MNIKVNEKINVVAVYNRNLHSKSTFFPWKIKWNEREYHIKKLTYYRKDRIGRDFIHVFYVTDGENDFHIEFSGEFLEWKLISISDGNAN